MSLLLNPQKARTLYIYSSNLINHRMKKTLQLIAALALSFFALESKAQLADGSVAPNFTFTDMNGNTQDLYTYLNAGKSVVIDISATWCSPCWMFHTNNN